MLDWSNCGVNLDVIFPIELPDIFCKNLGELLYQTLSRHSCLNRGRVCCVFHDMNWSAVHLWLVDFVIVRVFDNVHPNTRFPAEYWTNICAVDELAIK